MQIRPIANEAERAICVDIWLRAENDLGSKLSWPTIAAEDVEWLPGSLAHFVTTDPERFLIATRDGVPIGFGSAFVRDDFWFLSELMVAPEAQGSGVGTALLEALLPDESRRASMTLATVVETRQPISTMLYARYGMVPRVPQYWLQTAPALDALPGLPTGVRSQPLSLDRHAGAIDAFDAAYLGYTRGQEHAMFARDAEDARVYLDADGTVAGYGYVQPGNWGCPVASTSESLTAAIVRHLLEARPDQTGAMTVQVGGNASVLLPLLVRAGMRCEEGAQLIYCSTGRVPPPSYLHYGGYLP